MDMAGYATVDGNRAIQGTGPDRVFVLQDPPGRADVRDRVRERGGAAVGHWGDEGCGRTNRGRGGPHITYLVSTVPLYCMEITYIYTFFVVGAPVIPHNCSHLSIWFLIFCLFGSGKWPRKKNLVPIGLAVHLGVCLTRC